MVYSFKQKNSFELDVETISKDTIYEIADFLRNEHLLLDRFPFISAQKYNDSIKEIFRLCGITRIVTVLNPTTGNMRTKMMFS